jgi:type IV secretion system protein VirD4
MAFAHWGGLLPTKGLSGLLTGLALVVGLLTGCAPQEKPPAETIPEKCPGTESRPGMVVNVPEQQGFRRLMVPRLVAPDCTLSAEPATPAQIESARALTLKWQEIQQRKLMEGMTGQARAGSGGSLMDQVKTLGGGGPGATKGDWGSFAVQLLIAALAGGAVGAFFSQRARPIRHWLWLGALALALALAVWAQATPLPHAAIFFIVAVAVWKALRVFSPRSMLFGTAEWASIAHVQANNLVGTNGLLLGEFGGAGKANPAMSYQGERHLLTVAPTRSGKGTSAIIPNLLTYPGSVVVIDPKGENAIITAARRGTGTADGRIPGMGQTVHVVDPWGITGLTAAGFNPLDWLRPEDPDINENAMMLADSIVVPRGGSNSAFWDDESKAMLMGLLLYVALDPVEAPCRHLGRVRDIIVSDAQTFKAILERMFTSTNAVVSSTAARTASKAVELRANVMTSLQSHTHFLDSPRIRESLAVSSFNFADLKEKPTSIYLVLPADRLDTFGRWLRLLIQQAITINARNIAKKPEKPILFVLDEMPALGRLTMVEQAYSLMAGFGMQLWGIVQDLGQLERLYGQGWETFVGNSGVLQYFGSRDAKTAEYFSKLCGVTTVEKTSFSRSFSRAFGGGGGGSESSSVNEDTVQRPLVYPDELMRLQKGQQLLLIENCNAIRGQRVNWFDDERLKKLGFNLHKPGNLGPGAG